MSVSATVSGVLAVLDAVPRFGVSGADAAGSPKSDEEGEGEKEKDAKQDKKKKQPAAGVEVTLNNQQIELHIGPTRLLSRLIEGKFPDYEQIIPKGDMTKVLLETRDLTTAVKRMHYFAKEMNNNLTCRFSGSAAQISTPSTQLGKDEAELTAEVAGKPAKIALSSSYLLDFLGHNESEQTEVCVLDSLHPALFRIPGEKDFVHLIMPLRMQEE